MPSFDFAIRKRVAPPCLKKQAKSPLKKKYLFEGPVQPPLPQEQRGGLVYAPISVQLRLIIKGSGLNGFAPHLDTLEMQVIAVKALYMQLKADGFEISNVTNFRYRHAKALMDLWQQRRCSSRKFRMRWTVLLFWTRVLGKDSLLEPLKNEAIAFVRTKVQKERAAKSAPGFSNKVIGSSHV